jgi:hypothetical protein
MSSILTTTRKASAQRRYRTREPDILQRLFRERFPAFAAGYDDTYAASYGKFRLPLIERAAEAFRLCGDGKQGIDRVRCPDCKYDFFFAFS